ncbi:exopolyphosphatase/guanosine-5'-triphosphate,3'-diphosphate pyrophosphatase [Weissella uvarum]|uniref:Ppx/GppA phosphatase family protein n=1 Tax=Weissella uvarum TaxID=1479233 RepID=UPI00195FD4FA|nr:exopolyphosphatase [Weissella uvarum]MBM7617664.1 exopolyphosphatase/guanosine-5'-triphosphate,3'-diphosphate pyrophosphatase [Weissella uvarum]MCM0596013.1 exopolyphosphatase [Weissella uvarum]
MSYLAVIDFGSNSTRMVIEELDEQGQFTELKRRKLDTRMAQGMDQNDGNLTDAAIQRAVDALLEFKKDYERYPEIELEGIATAAVREAHNQDVFLNQVLDVSGIEVRVLTGDQEAYYDYLGAMCALDVDDAWLLDTGGASVELVSIEDRMADNFVSLPFGAVNLAEKFHLNQEKLDPKDVQAAVNYIENQYDQLSWVNDSEEPLPIILLGGANRSLARLDRLRHGYDVKQDFHGYRMSVDDVMATFDELLHASLPERQAALGTEANRADIIISGLLPLVVLIRDTKAREVIFSSSGVREGLLQEYRMSLN